jgi:hypothetical protein
MRLLQEWFGQPFPDEEALASIGTPLRRKSHSTLYPKQQEHPGPIKSVQDALDQPCDGPTIQKGFYCSSKAADEIRVGEWQDTAPAIFLCAVLRVDPGELPARACHASLLL